MKVENLEVGKVYKNYKELCEVLEVKTKTGEARQIQLKDFARYFNYEKQGHKITITEIFEEPLEKEKDNRGGNNVLPFVDEMEILILEMLLNHDKEMVKSNSALISELCMVNQNYYEFISNPKELSIILNVDKRIVEDYYETTNSTFKSALGTVFRRLVNKKLIIHEKIMMVVYVDTSVHVTPTGQAKASDIFTYDSENDKYISRNIAPKEVVRRANTREKEIILRLEKEILDRYDVDSTQELFFNGKISEFYKEISGKMYETLNVKRAYMANYITFIRESVEDELEKIYGNYPKDIVPLVINSKVADRLNENAKSRHDKQKDKFLLESKRAFLRAENGYVEQSQKLTENIIKSGKEKLTSNNKKPKEIDNELSQYVIDNMPESL